MSAKSIVLLLVTILFFVFIFQNLAMTTVTFLFFDISMPGSLLLIITFAIGLLIGIFLPVEFKKKKKERTRNDA